MQITGFDTNKSSSATGARSGFVNNKIEDLQSRAEDSKAVLTTQSIWKNKKRLILGACSIIPIILVSNAIATAIHHATQGPWIPLLRRRWRGVWIFAWCALMVFLWKKRATVDEMRAMRDAERLDARVMDVGVRRQSYFQSLGSWAERNIRQTYRFGPGEKFVYGPIIETIDQTDYSDPTAKPLSQVAVRTTVGTPEYLFQGISFHSLYPLFRDDYESVSQDKWRTFYEESRLRELPPQKIDFDYLRDLGENDGSALFGLEGGNQVVAISLTPTAETVVYPNAAHADQMVRTLRKDVIRHHQNLV